MHKPFSRLFLLAAASLAISGCSQADLSDNFLTEDAQVSDDAVTSKRLKSLPLPANPVVLAVYSFEDKTGQHKSSDDFPEYSRAVTQGGASLLNKALYDAGSGGWFRVLEREGLNNLVQERKIIRATRQEYSADSSLGDVGPLLYAGLLLEGGIVAYETNVTTGGAGARYLGVGAHTQYRRDIVTVALRAISVRTGEVLVAVNTSKTIFSTALQGGVNKFIAIDELLEIESGVSLNEPPQYAVRQAIEMAVYSMVVEGAIKGLWDFASPSAGQAVIREYLMKRDRLDEDDPALPRAERSMPMPNVPMARPVPPAVPSRPVPIVPDRSAPAPASEMAPPLPPKRLPPPPSAADLPPPPPAPSFGDLPPPPTLPRYEGGYRDTPRKAVLKQLPADAKPNPTAKIEPLKADENDPQNIEELQPYSRQGVVYCGPSGCVPTNEAPTGR